MDIGAKLSIHKQNIWKVLNILFIDNHEKVLMFIKAGKLEEVRFLFLLEEYPILH